MRYARRLRRVSRQVGHIITALNDGRPDSVSRMQRSLNGYADAIDAWAAAEAWFMLVHVGRENEPSFGQVLDNTAKRAFAAWLRSGQDMEQHAIKQQLLTNVAMIRSIPIKAGERVHHVTTAGTAKGWDASRLLAAIKETVGITNNRATSLAGDLVSQAEQAITQTRAQHLGSPGYTWRTRRDNRVREAHREMENRFVRWGSPPTLSDGTRFHAGCAPNCRCYAEPVL